MDVAVDNNGCIYAVDSLNHRLQKFASDGTFLGWLGYGTSV
jgi:hypothetical protein